MEHHVCLRTCLLLVVVAAHIGQEGDVVGQPLYFVVFEEFEVLVFGLDPREGLECLDKWRVGVLERAAVVVGILVFGGWVHLGLFIEAEVDGEVGGIPRHGILALYVEFQPGY